MSAAYNHKLKRREEREGARTSLNIAKLLFKKWSNEQVMRSKAIHVKNIRAAILEITWCNLFEIDLDEVQDSWLDRVREDICTRPHKSVVKFRELLKYPGQGPPVNIL